MNQNPKYDVTASIVTYNNDESVLSKAIQSFLNTSLSVKLYISDNSEKDVLRTFAEQFKDVEYIFNNSNLGFGHGHNLIFKKVATQSRYHLVLNPDIEYQDTNLLKKLIDLFENDSSIGGAMPKVLYPDGSTQYLAKLLPNPIDLFARRFLPFLANNKFDLAFTNYTFTMDTPFISGCFLFSRTALLNDLGGFDERFFMYCEDIDLSRRINDKHRTVFYPEVEVVHHYEKGSYKSSNLLKIHIRSALAYFNKWGWIIDRKKAVLNQKALKQIAIKMSK